MTYYLLFEIFRIIVSQHFKMLQVHVKAHPYFFFTRFLLISASGWFVRLVVLPTTSVVSVISPFRPCTSPHFYSVDSYNSYKIIIKFYINIFLTRLGYKLYNNNWFKISNKSKGIENRLKE